MLSEWHSQFRWDIHIFVFVVNSFLLHVVVIMPCLLCIFQGMFLLLFEIPLLPNIIGVLSLHLCKIS